MHPTVVREPFHRDGDLRGDTTGGASSRSAMASTAT
jgi:hypothetical protein